MITIGLDSPFAVSAETRKEQTALKARIAAFNSAWGDHSQQSDSLRSMAADEWTPDYERAAQKLSGQRIDLLRGRLALHSQIDEMLAQIVGPECLAARDAASDRLQAASIEVRRKLLAIGYSAEGPIPSLTPGMVASHPTVQAARNEHDAIGTTSLEEARRANVRAADDCRNQLADMQRKATAALA